MTALQESGRVLLGGRSAEREVSLVSGRACAKALREEGFDTVEIDAPDDLPAQSRSAKSPMRSSTRCMAVGARMAACRACSN
jgi:hypothetical protein